uniref:Uncharacterized protein n=1 Tax=Rhipicephalus microplus TaxID=6941 RepID=A0A6G5AIQ8_RHIMP
MMYNSCTFACGILQYLLLVLHELYFTCHYMPFVCYNGLIVTGSSDVAVCITAVRSLSTRAFIEACYDVIDKFCCLLQQNFFFVSCYLPHLLCLSCYVLIGIV